MATGSGSAAFDILITRARVVDGTGAPWFRADVGVIGDRIAAVGALGDASARLRIDAGDLVLAPGFVDAHVHAETLLLREPVHLAGLRQGVTTHVGGQDGFGFAPADEATLAFMYEYLVAIYRDGPRVAPGGVADYLARYDGASTVNLATLVPNGCVRFPVMGNDPARPTPEQLAAMRELARRAMEEGAVGLSTGLDYVPSGYAATDELVALCEAVAPLGGVYVTHVRYRDAGLLPGLEEALAIGRRARVPVHVSHLMGDADAGAWSADILGRLEVARADGVDVTFDTYPYTFGCTFLGIALPPFALAGTREEAAARLRDPGARERIRAELGEAGRRAWASLVIAGELRPEHAHLIGRDVQAAADAAGADPVDLACDLLLAHDLDVLILGVSSEPERSERDLRAMLAHPAHVLGSDGIYREGRIHPRGFGAVARYLGPLVRDGMLPFEEAVRHATSAPARRFGLADRGLVRPGFAADLVVLDPDALCDRATPERVALADGVRDVLVNGVPALLDGEATGATPGRGLRRTID